ncbi:nuclear pore [Purpureocillium lavendulum]|uniref:Nuclear pore n=1 Tax=Purpureocillium lavendulum TaxID=1247861 RepID=A0AB34FY92_9HYPO|nr:nuclear pore [Purpureocillium lavendulum]
MTVLPSSEKNNASSPPSSASAASTPAPRQPTYTTAGTIYNPNSSQPLQPPARRGRATRWNGVGVNQTGLCLFPKAVLAGLTLKTATNGRTTSMPQYSPLQQNSDRAVSPLSTYEHSTMGVALAPQAPRLRHGNVSPAPVPKETVIHDADAAKGHIPTADGNGHDCSGKVDDQQEETDKEGRSGHTAHLMSMSMNALQNLASYPNPAQKDAQKLLKPSVDMAAAKHPLCCPAPASYPLYPLQQRVDEGTGTKGGSGLSSLRPSQVDGTNKNVAIPTGLLPISRSSSPASSLEQVMTPTSSASSSSVLGAPAPLTAGPPGQRQYRPVTYDSMMKHFQPANQTPVQLAEHMSAVKYANETGFRAEARDDHFGPVKTVPPLSLRKYFDGNELIKDPSSPETQPEPQKKSLLTELVETSEPDGPPVRRNTGASSYVDGPAWHQGASSAVSPLQLRRPMLVRPPFGSGYYAPMPAFVGPNDPIRNARQQRIDQDWYAGSDRLGKSMDEIAAEAEHRRRQCRFGAVGDGRPKPAPKTEYPPIPVDLANRIPTPKHTEVLMNMALDSLVHAVDEGNLGSAFYKWAEEMDRKYGGKVCAGKTGEDDDAETETETEMETEMDSGSESESEAE